MLSLDLGRLCMKPPASVVNGGIERTRDWLRTQKDCLKLLKSNRASVSKLSAAVNRMRGFL